MEQHSAVSVFFDALLTPDCWDLPGTRFSLHLALRRNSTPSLLAAIDSFRNSSPSHLYFPPFLSGVLLSTNSSTKLISQVWREPVWGLLKVIQGFNFRSKLLATSYRITNSTFSGARYLIFSRYASCCWFSMVDLMIQTDYAVNSIHLIILMPIKV